MEALFYIIFSIALLWLLYSWWKSRKSYWEKLGVPGPKPKPLIGNLLDNILKPNNVLLVERARKYGPVYGYLEFNKPVLVIGDPELLKDVLIKDFHIFGDRENPSIDERLNNCLPSLRGHHWKRVRKFSTPAFTSLKMQQMLPAMTESVHNLLTTLSNSGSTQDVNLRLLFSALTVDVFARCAYGIQSDALRNPNDELLYQAKALTEFKISSVLLVSILPRWLCKILKIDVVPANSYSYFEATVQSMLESNSDYSNKSNLFSLWVQSINDGSDPSLCLSFDELAAQALIFLAAGYETTDALLTYCFYTLALEEEIQDRLYEEVTKHFESTSDIVNDDLSSCDYLNAFIDEALRMYSPVVYWDRVANQDYVLGDTGITVKKGTKVVTPFYAVHYDPKLYPEPEKFRPERFTKENRDSLPKYAFLPFGLGPRNCIGLRFALQEVRLTIAHILRRFKVVRTAKTKYPPKYVGRFLALQTEPLFVRFSKRE